MKKIKVFIIALLIIVGFAFMPPTVQAAEVTTEPVTTEEVTTDLITEEEVIVTEFDLDAALEKAKTWIVAAMLSVLGNGTLAGIAYIILNKMKKSAYDQINAAVEQNKISQTTANAATKMIDDGVVAIQVKIDSFERTVSDKIETLDEHTKEMIDKLDAKFLTLFNEALQEYFSEDIEETEEENQPEEEV